MSTDALYEKLSTKGVDHFEGVLISLQRYGATWDIAAMVLQSRTIPLYQKLLRN